MKVKKLCTGTSFHSEHASQSFAWVKPLFSDMTLYVKIAYWEGFVLEHELF